MKKCYGRADGTKIYKSFLISCTIPSYMGNHLPKVNTEQKPDLLGSLVNKAANRRSLHILAMAFRLKNPRWGSQSMLICIGLSQYLDYIDWNYELIEDRLLDYMDLMDPVTSSPLRSLRLTQSRHLKELVDSEDGPVSLRPASNSKKDLLLTQYANSGFMLYELIEHLQTSMMSDSEEAQLLLPLINSLTVEQYIKAVHPDDQPNHPNVLDQRITDYKERMFDVSNTYSVRPVTATSPALRA